jgi:hypothetical protein
MKSYKGLVLLIGLALIVSVCGTVAISAEEHARQVTCSQVIVMPVLDLDGHVITRFVSGELKSHYEYNANQKLYYRYPVTSKNGTPFTVRFTRASKGRTHNSQKFTRNQDLFKSYPLPMPTSN